MFDDDNIDGPDDGESRPEPTQVNGHALRVVF